MVIKHVETKLFTIYVVMYVHTFSESRVDTGQIVPFVILNCTRFYISLTVAKTELFLASTRKLHF